MLNDDTSGGIWVFEMKGASAKLADTLAIDSRQPRFTELLLDFSDVIFCGHAIYVYLGLNCFVNI